MNDHLVYVDDSPHGELHLSLERRRPHGAMSRGVSPGGGAAELAAWLDAHPARPWGDLLVTTSRVHDGDFGPVVDVLTARRPRIGRLALGAQIFPDFERGDSVPDDLSRDGSAWRLEVPSVDHLLEALPGLEVLAVQASDVETRSASAPFEALALRRLVLRAETMAPATLARLGRGAYPALTQLELWLGRIAYGWDATANDLAPVLEGAALPALRHLKLVSDLDAALIDALADSAWLSGLETLDLAHGVLDDAAVDRLAARFSRFAHLERLILAGNALTPEGAARARRLGPRVVVGSQRHAGNAEVPFAPPMVSLFDALTD